MHYVTLSVMKSFKPAIKATWVLCCGSNRINRYFLNTLLSKSQPFGFPTKTNPLANIISEASPQGFHAHLDHTAQAKLTQTKFVFDPGVRKLCDPGSLFIDLLRLVRSASSLQTPPIEPSFPCATTSALFYSQDNSEPETDSSGTARPAPGSAV